MHNAVITRDTQTATASQALPYEAGFELTSANSRNVAVDAYRGLVMLLMMAEVLQLARVAQAYPGNRSHDGRSSVASCGGCIDDRYS